MDPFVATILKQSAVITAVFLAAGLLVAAMYGLSQYSNLQYAKALNMVPGQLS